MTNDRFSEPERFLMKKWDDVTMLQQSIESISDKYDVICREVLEAVREKFPELDTSRVRPDSDSDGRQIALGKKRWPRMWDGWPSGLWVSGIGLEYLTSETEDPPGASIWLRPPTSLGFEPSNARNRVCREAKKLMSDDQFRRCSTDDDRWTCLWYTLPESRQALLAMLLKDQAKDFVDCMVSHFEVLAKFIPVVDELLLVKNRVRRI